MQKPLLTFFVGLLSILSYLSVSADPEPTIRVVCEDKCDFPYLLGDGSKIEDHKPGLAVEALRILEEKRGIRFEFVRESWKRCFQSLASGDVDALFYASYRPERAKEGVYPMKEGKVDPERRFISISYVLYTLTDSPIRWDGETLENVDGRIGVLGGYSIVDDLKKRGVRIDESRGILNDFRKLTLNRLAGVVALETNGDFTLRKNPDLAGKIVKRSPDLVTKQYYLLFSHPFYEKNRTLVEEIWSALSEIRSSEAFIHRVDEYL